MILKKLYSKKILNINNLLDKKILSKMVYNKFFIRNLPSDGKKEIYILDNNNAFFHIHLKNLRKQCMLKNGTHNFFFGGISFYSKEFLFVNKSNILLKFKSILTNFQPQSLYLYNFINNLRLKKNHLIFKKRRSFYLYSVLKKRKGGYLGLCNGTREFISKKNAAVYYKNLFFSQKKTLSFLKLLINKKSFIRKKFGLKLLIKFNKRKFRIKRHTLQRKRRFSKSHSTYKGFRVKFKDNQYLFTNKSFVKKNKVKLLPISFIKPNILLNTTQKYNLLLNYAIFKNKRY